MFLSSTTKGSFSVPLSFPLLHPIHSDCPWSVRTQGSEAHLCVFTSHPGKKASCFLCHQSTFFGWLPHQPLLLTALPATASCYLATPPAAAPHCWPSYQPRFLAASPAAHSPADCQSPSAAICLSAMTSAHQSLSNFQAGQKHSPITTDFSSE